MKISLLVHSPPSSASAVSAYQFARSVTSNGHECPAIFFYGDGVLNGNALISPPSDELNLVKAWQELAKESGTELLVCIASAVRRGVINEAERKRYEKDTHNLADVFEIVGLGQLVDLTLSSDRLVTFGG